MSQAEMGRQVKHLILLILLAAPALADTVGQSTSNYPTTIAGAASGKTIIPRLDASTSSFQVIDYEHHEIHSGSSFTAHYSNDVTNIGEMTCIGFNTPNTTKWAHFVFEAATTQPSYIALYENPSVDVDEGTDLAVYNRNRNSATTSTLTSIETAATANVLTSYTEAQAAGANITTATELIRRYLGAGQRVSASGGTARGDSEIVLDQNQQYILCAVALTADDNTQNLTLDWYEHTDAN
jgi:hypothetical protein